MRDIVIRDNDISAPQAGVYIGSTRNPSTTHLHGKVTIVGNRFHHAPDQAIRATCVRELTVEGNEYLQ